MNVPGQAPQPPLLPSISSIYHQVAPNLPSLLQTAPRKERESAGTFRSHEGARARARCTQRMEAEGRPALLLCFPAPSPPLPPWMRKPSEKAWHAAAPTDASCGLDHAAGPGGRGKARLRGHPKAAVFQTLPHLSYLARPVLRVGTQGGWRQPSSSLATAPVRRLCFASILDAAQGQMGKESLHPE